MCVNKLGQRHYDALTSMMNLALIRKDMSSHEDAIGLLQSPFDTRQQVLDADHPYTAQMLSILKSWREKVE